MKKTLFLVTSAIKTPWTQDGLDLTKRYFETVNTINSINANVRYCDIWILDSSHSKFVADYSHLINAPNVKYISFSEDPNVKNITKNAETYAINAIKNKRYQLPNDPDKKEIFELLRNGYIKSMTESYVTKVILDNNSFDEYDHVVKISGRYSLSSIFNISNFRERGKYVFSHLRKSEQKMCNIDYQYRTVIWSFCTSILDEVRKDFSNTRNILETSYNNLEIVDLEHAIFEGTKHNTHLIKNLNSLNKKGVYGLCGGKMHVE